ncbi:LytR/AlgR family response regulator transcription factor [Ekhidna sp. To15]|uniref:LytR/AlgR family response regulator transcription factor n=1 Tax=Ekhidna sp. To15 TaxID=3395267 RepID=UPI003F51F6BA
MITCIAIDDDPLFLQMISSYFDKYDNMELISTHPNPVNGIMQVVKKKPDVLLIDLEMPYLDGFETLDTLDKKPKIVMISAHVNQPAREKKLKIDKYIRKVSLTQELLRKVIEDVVTE